MGFAVFRNFAAVKHLEAITLKDACSAPCFKGYHLAVDLAHPLAAEVIQIAVHQLGAVGEPLRLRQDIEVEVGAAAGSLRNLLPRGA